MTALLYRVIREGLSEEVTGEWRLERLGTNLAVRDDFKMYSQILCHQKMEEPNFSPPEYWMGLVSPF